MMQSSLTQNITNTFNELQDILFAFSPEQYNTVPSPESWTAGMVTEHILKSLDGISRLMQEAAPQPGRVPDEKVKALEDLFLNFSIKMQSPDFIYPVGHDHRKEEQLQMLDIARTQLLDAEKLEPGWVCTSFEVPTFGYFTRLEWIHFYLVHTQRHTQQLKNIFQSFK